VIVSNQASVCACVCVCEVRAREDVRLVSSRHNAIFSLCAQFDNTHERSEEIHYDCTERTWNMQLIDSYSADDQRGR
jgi:hypothetical protein